MSSSGKQEFAPLWPAGFHALTTNEIRERCVDAFPLSLVRKDLVDALESVVEDMRAAGIIGEIWLDGSFVTEKIDPDDIDFILVVEAEVAEAATGDERAILDGLVDGEPWKPPSVCDTNVVCTDLPEQQGAANALAYWKNRLGFSVSDRTPKGIVVIRVGETRRKTSY
jgi:hypothetical protein